MTKKAKKHAYTPSKKTQVWVSYRGKFGPLAPIKVALIEPAKSSDEKQKFFLTVDSKAKPSVVRDRVWNAVQPEDEEMSSLIFALRAYRAVCETFDIFECDNIWKPFQHTALNAANPKEYDMLVEVVTEVIGPEAGESQRKAFSPEGREAWDAKQQKSKKNRKDIVIPELKTLAPIKLPKAVPANPEEAAAFIICLVLTFSGVGNRRKVSTSQIEVKGDSEQEHKADKNWLAVSKKLIDAPEYEAIQSLDGEARRFIESQTLPADVLLKRGTYLVPKTSREKISQYLDEKNAQRAILVEKLIAAYGGIMANAKERLGSLYNPQDYWTATQLRNQFRLTYRFIVFDLPDKREIGERAYQQEKAKAEAQWKEAIEECSQLLRAQFAELVNHLINRLTPGDDGKQKTFKDSMVGNLNDFFEAFDPRNGVTADAQLAVLVDRARAITKGMDAEVLRQSEGCRQHVTDGFQQIKAVLDPLIVSKPKRSISFED